MKKVSTYLDKWRKANEAECFQFTEPTSKNLKNLQVNPLAMIKKLSKFLMIQKQIQ